MKFTYLLAIAAIFSLTVNAFTEDKNAPGKPSPPTSDKEKRSEKKSHKPMNPRLWFANYQKYNASAKKVQNTADARYKLGKWAWDNGLEDEAWEQWIVAVTLDKNHASTRKAMGYIKKNEKWIRPGTINNNWLKTVEADQRAFNVTMTIADDADQKFLDEFAWRVRRLNWFMWSLTEGQVYLKSVQIKDKATGGRFHVEKGKRDIPVLRGGGAYCIRPGRPNWEVRSGGKCYVRILAHEMCHGIFGVPDERHGCYCLMQGGLFGIKTKDLILCNDKTHRRHRITPNSCWSIVKKKYPKMVQPNKANYGIPPETKIKIINQ